MIDQVDYYHCEKPQDYIDTINRICKKEKMQVTLGAMQNRK